MKQASLLRNTLQCELCLNVPHFFLIDFTRQLLMKWATIWAWFTTSWTKRAKYLGSTPRVIRAAK